MGGYKTRFLKLLMKISLYWTQFLHNYYMCHEFKAPLKFLCYFVICAMQFTAPLKFLCSFVICDMEVKALIKFLFALVICDPDIGVQIRPKMQIFRLIAVWYAGKHTWFLWVYYKHTTLWSCSMIVKVDLAGKQKCVWWVEKFLSKNKNYQTGIWFSAYTLPLYFNFVIKLEPIR